MTFFHPIFRQLSLEEALKGASDGPQFKYGPSFSESVQKMAEIETKDEAMTRSLAHADEAWKNRCLNVIEDICLRLPYFSSDDVSEELTKYSETTHDLHAIGPMMKAAAKRGFCEATNSFPPSRNPKNHSCPRRQWRSLLFS